MLVLSSSRLKSYADFILRSLSSISERSPDLLHHYHYTKKQSLPIHPNAISLLFKYLGNSNSFKQGLSIHGDVIKMGFESYTAICNSITSFYIKCEEFDSALDLFDRMLQRDSVSWNALIHGFLKKEDFSFGFTLFMEGRVSKFEPNVSTLVLVIQACWRLESFQNGLNLHANIIKTGFLSALSIQNALLNMYVKFQDLNMAQKCFDEIFEKDVISWSTLINGYAQSRSHEITLKLFSSMYRESEIIIDEFTIVSILQTCAMAKDTNKARVVHAYLLSRGFNNDIFICNSLVDTYSKCLDMDSSLRVFANMTSTNVVSWNSIISGLIHGEKYTDALLVFDSMRRNGVVYDAFTITNLLQVCKNIKLIMCYKCIHGILTRRWWFLSTFVWNSLLDASTKCDSTKVALKIFDRVPNKDVVSWSTIISGLANSEMPYEAIYFFNAMRSAKVSPNSVTMLSLLEACSASAEHNLSKCAHCLVIRSFLSNDVAICTSIIDMYAKCSDLNSSRTMFDKMHGRNVQTWNAMIGGLGMNGHAKEALSMFREMESRNVKANVVTMLLVISACSHGGLVEEGLSLFERMKEDRTVRMSLEVYSCTVDMLARAGNFEGAIKVIKEMPEEMEVGSAAWSALLSACRSYGNLELGKLAGMKVMEMEPEKCGGYVLSSSIEKRESRDCGARIRSLMKEKKVRMVVGYSVVHVDGGAHKFVAWDVSHTMCVEIYCMVELLHGCMRAVEYDEMASRPIDPSVIYLQAQHRTNNIDMMERVESDGFIDNSSTLKFIMSAHLGVLELLDGAGFGVANKLGFIQIDRNLLMALIDRWRRRRLHFILQ